MQSKLLEEAHERDLGKQRELWQAAEKLKRDKWIADKTKAIKDATVQALEPDIKAMLAQQKIQIRQLEEKFREDVIREKSILAEHHQRQMDALRHAMDVERVRACEEEREFARQRYLESGFIFLATHTVELYIVYPAQFQQQKRKLHADFDEQKHAMSESAKAERQSEEAAHRRTVDDLRRELDAARVAKEAAVDEARRRGVAEAGALPASQRRLLRSEVEDAHHILHQLAQLREKMSIEKEEWQTHYMAKQENEMRNREVKLVERHGLLGYMGSEAVGGEPGVTVLHIQSSQKALKERLVKERDAEIEMVIQRLESETSAGSSEASRRYRIEVEKLKSEMAEEIKQLRDQHSLALDKVLAAQTALAKAEETRREMQKQIMQAQHESASKENLIRQQKNELMRLKVDEDTLSKAIRREFEDQITRKDAALQSLNETLAAHDSQLEALRRRHERELEDLAGEKDRTIRIIEDKVRKTVALKDDIVASLRSQVEELGIRSGHLERLIDKQRKELLS
ncbi:hypothetical protein BDK51DRAFT_29486 [Blyttiomyces helicus]|uniref:Uncharacterized protein n=1 Tax=Blyttiomyces helicus TaxID=388810 RepID=A0A4V1ISS2_9FUNG|nr:hypothetical protein BDK51DRAFT_29486 [Blyttiomyces helicus]|eukprot:RKO94547.1 hypothetical protein BDK51DRAFT_29486 [Blyttiomyces helicus]